MENEIKSFSAKNDHAEADMTAMVVMSHGDEGEISSTDGEVLMIEWILEQFKNSNCPSLRGKPKIFIFNSCRGSRGDPGVPATATDNGERVSSWGDMIIVYSTIPGHYSLRNTKDGSWFVQSLCKVFREKATTYEITEMLNADVSNRLSEHQTWSGMKQPFEYAVRPPFKKLYFFPDSGNTGSSRGKYILL